MTSPNVPVAPAAAKILGISADPNYQRPPPPRARQFNSYDNREMSPPPPGGGSRLFDPYSTVYMGPPNTSSISPLTSKYVDPIAGIYLGPPEPAARSAGGTGRPTAAPPAPSANIYRDPDFAEVEYNRGLRPAAQQQPMAGQFGGGGMPHPPPAPGFQPPLPGSFQPSSYPSGNRRIN